MGSSSGSDYAPPANQGPPIDKLNPGQGAPNPAWVNFLPGSGPATGITPDINAQIAAQNRRPATATRMSPQQGANTQLLDQLKLAMPGGPGWDRIGPRYGTMAQQLVERQNQNPSLENYLQGREQLASLMRQGMAMRNPMGGGGPGSGRGSYGSSGPSSGGGRLA